MENVEKKYGNIKVRVDYRTELLGIIQLISNYKNRYSHLIEEKNNNEYRDNIFNKFLQYADHKIITLFNSFIEGYNFSYDAPIDLFLQLDEHFTCTKLNDYILLGRLDNDKRIFEFINELDDFAKEINFKEFYNSNKDFYLKCIDSLNLFFKKNDINKMIDEYLGNINEIVINLLPYATHSNYGIVYKNEVYICVGLNRKDQFGFISNGTDCYFAELLFHEYCHSVINPLTAKQEIFTNKSNIFNDVLDVMKKQAYGEVLIILNETIIRGLGIRFFELYYSKKVAKEELANNIKAGFKHINIVIELLKTYENHRDTYKRIEDFYPVLINGIKNEYERVIKNQ